MAYLPPKEAALELGIHSVTLRKMHREGQFPEGSVLKTPGGHYRYDTEQIKRHLAAKK